MKPAISRIILVVALLFSLSFFALALPGHTGASEEISLAPLSQEFLDYLKQFHAGTLTTTTADSHGLGYIPPPLDLSELKGLNVFGSEKLLAFPTTYDLRILGRVTPVKDQGNCGCCWAFASIASLESTLLPGETWDFSENNLKNTHGFDFGHCGGGNGQMATAYFARFSGPVSEADDPYNPSSDVSPADLPARKLVNDVIYIPARADSLDNSNLKQAVMAYGAVGTSMHWEAAFFNASTFAYYYPTNVDRNHGVTIVGWDDNFDKGKFKSTPPGNGAFIVKNSWGLGWGQAGYFYISYYDGALAGNLSYAHHNAVPADEVKRVYHHDPLGATWQMGCQSGPSEFANRFTAVENESLAAVSFYTFYPGVSYEVTVTTTSLPANSQIEAKTIGTIDLPGYHTVALASLVAIAKGQEFFVAMKVSHPSEQYLVPLEHPISNYSGTATAKANQSFYRCGGGQWKDITEEEGLENTNVCLKAITTAPPSSYTLKVSRSGMGGVTSSPGGINCGSTCSASVPTGQTVTLNATPDTNYLFSNWQGDCSGTSTSCDVVMNSDRTVTAVFVPVSIEQVKLKVTKTKVNKGDGTVQTADGRIACGTDCEEPYLKYSVVTLNLTPLAPSVFDGWSGACTGTAATCVITMNADKNVTASFTGPFTLTVGKTSKNKGTGTVTSAPAGINCGTTCTTAKAGFPYKSSVTLTAVSDTGSNSVFTGWSGTGITCPGTGTCTITIDKAYTVKAGFVGPSILTVGKTSKQKGTGTVTSDPAGINCGTTRTTAKAGFLANSSVMLTAVADTDSNSVFTGWSGTGITCPGTGTCTVTMDKAYTVKATFVGPSTLTVSKTSKNKGTGTVTSAPAGINCGTACSTAKAGFAFQSPVMLKATHALDSVFTGWSGTGISCPGTGTCTVTMDKAYTVKATFTGP